MGGQIPPVNITRIRADRDRYIFDIDETGLGVIDAVVDEGAPSSVWGEAWERLRRRPTFQVAAFIIALIVLLALFPSLFTMTDPKFCELSPPPADPSAGYPFGFGKQGCDIYARVVYGAHTFMSIGILATLTVMLVGGTIGALAGYFSGWFDALFSRITDVFFTVPLLLAAIVFIQVFEDSRSAAMVVIVLSMFGWTSIARITRGSVPSMKSEEFMTAARAAGASCTRIFLSHIIPSSITSIVVYATVALGAFTMSEASLSFIDIGLPTSVVSWGADISSTQTSLYINPTALSYPGAALALTVLSFTTMGDVVREAFDPKARR